jgi:hypothetical protein
METRLCINGHLYSLLKTNAQKGLVYAMRQQWPSSASEKKMQCMHSMVQEG